MMSSQLKPSELLTDLSSSLPNETFLKLLNKTVYPVLDALPEDSLSTVVAVLEVAQREHEELAERLDSIDYDGTKEELQGMIKALKKDVKRDWHDGWEAQGEMMEEIAGTIYEWLPTLWTVGVEDGVEPNLIHKSLKLCHNITNQVFECGSRAEFSDVEGSVNITDRSNKVVYWEKYPTLFGAIAWVWRELLLATLVNDRHLAEVFMDDIDKLGFSKDVESLLRKDKESETERGYSFYDEHWSVQMKQAAENLKQVFNAKRIALFESNPTFEAYTTLVATSQDLESKLLNAARQHFFDNTLQKVAWGHASRIFKHAKSKKDLLRILEVAEKSFYKSSALKTAQRDIVTHLIEESDEDRAKARPHLENGLNDALKKMWEEVGQAFPGLDEAFDYLEEKLDSKKLTKKEKRSPASRSDPKRNAILENFVKLAKTAGYDYSSDVENYRYDVRMGGIDKDDSDYEEMTEHIHPDIAGDIEAWIAVLNKWPNTPEADEIRNKFKARRGDDFFYTVDGVAEELAARCDFDWNHSSRQVHIAEGIRAAYNAFGPHN